MCVRSYQPCMQALHQGGYATTYVYVYVYVFLGNTYVATYNGNIYTGIIDLYYAF